MPDGTPRSRCTPHPITHTVGLQSWLCCIHGYLLKWPHPSPVSVLCTLADSGSIPFRRWFSCVLVCMWFGASCQTIAFTFMGKSIVVFVNSPFALLLGTSSHHHSHPVELATAPPLSGRIWVQGAWVTTGKQLAVCPGSDTLHCSCHIFRCHITFVCTFESDPLQNSHICRCHFPPVGILIWLSQPSSKQYKII